MTIDERIERLTERHEALAQSMQLLHLDVRELTANAAASDARINAVSQSVDVLHRSVLDLLTIVRSRETRIVRLEGAA